MQQNKGIFPDFSCSTSCILFLSFLSSFKYKIYDNMLGMAGGLDFTPLKMEYYSMALLHLV